MTTTLDAALERPQTLAASGTFVVTHADATSGEYVLSDGGTRTAMRAVSCLVLPAVGDLVACAAGDKGAAWITAVLFRASEAPLTVSLPPGTTIESAGGALVLQADTLHLRARALGVEGELAHLNVEQVSGVGRKASWSYGAVKLTADLVESFAERVVQFSRWSQRMVDGPDMVRSRQIDWRAEQTLQLQAQVVIANADKLFKADADQIHLG